MKVKKLQDLFQSCVSMYFHPVFAAFSSCICCICCICKVEVGQYFITWFYSTDRRLCFHPGHGILYGIPSRDVLLVQCFHPGPYHTIPYHTIPYHTILSRVNKSLSLSAPDQQPLHAMRLWGFRCHAKMTSRWRHDQRSMPVAQIQLAYLRGFCFRSTKTTLSLSILVGM